MSEGKQLITRFDLDAIRARIILRNDFQEEDLVVDEASKLMGVCKLLEQLLPGRAALKIFIITNRQDPSPPIQEAADKLQKSIRDFVAQLVSQFDLTKQLDRVHEIIRQESSLLEQTRLTRLSEDSYAMEPGLSKNQFDLFALRCADKSNYAIQMMAL